MSKDKPDNVADNPGLLPYASNVGAPAIKPDDVATWKSEKVVKTNHYFETRYNEIKEEYRKLIESYEWNKLVYESEFKWEPVKGETYYLYQRSEGNQDLFLSLIEPQYNEWIFIGAFKLDSNDKWEKVE
jgi:hypothetical protein